MLQVLERHIFCTLQSTGTENSSKDFKSINKVIILNSLEMQAIAQFISSDLID